ncbi:uncharacterized protein LOC122502800 [Leptopilina heterotoma]|uniref:uncharacterized protein LOC122502800 n=1 Tax=Leptopilina heterotoma TaxID=63436 RepID=UPI001CA91A7A|nr:uncharacterized protein LOC122502800 [Leptopilina heterotoma]
MNNTTSASQLLLNHHFLTVCQYITSFGIFFNNQGLLAIDDENDTVLVLNTLFDYLRKSQNESAAKLQLVKSALERNLPSDGRNETFDMKYVNDTFWYIISKSLFHQHENIDNYLTSLVDVIDKEWNEFYPQIKETVLANLLKTKAKNCSSKSKTTKTTSLIIEQVFEKYILPILEKRTDLDISRKELFNVTRKYLKRSKRSDEVPTVSTNQSPTFLRLLKSNKAIIRQLTSKRWNELLTDSNTINILRPILQKLAYNQADQIWLKSPKNLWYTDVTNSVLVLQYLRNLKGHLFFFNDITIMSEVQSIAIRPYSKKEPFKTAIYYNCYIESQYGFADLSSLGINKYATFPDVLFTVTDVETKKRPNGGIDLYITLKPQPLAREIWKVNRLDDYNSLSSFNKNTNNVERLKIIEQAANKIASNVPLCTLTTAIELLKCYILKMEASKTYTPTYEKFADDYSKKLRIERYYKNFLMTKTKLVNNLLYESTLDNIENFESAINRISKHYSINDEKQMQMIFDKYTSSSAKNSIYFEDYFIINTKFNELQILYDRTKMDILKVTICRIALRQTDMEPIEGPIILYYGSMVHEGVYKDFLKLQKQEVFAFNSFYKFSTKMDFEMEKLSSDSELKAIFIEIALNDPTGIADIGRYLIFENKIFSPYFTMQFVVDNMSHEIINSCETLVIKLHDLSNPKEERMVQMTKELSEMIPTKSEEKTFVSPFFT